MKKVLCAGMAAMLLLTPLSGCGKEESSSGFSPRLDTEEKVVLNTTGFFGNFEALDQVTNDFNAYYPNVEFTYEQVGGETFDQYLEANPNVDIMMTSQELLEKENSPVKELCADLSKEDIDFSAIEESMLSMNRRDGKLAAIPMGQNIYGVIVNVSLLEKEGFAVPTNYKEFIETAAALKEKGYTPIQGPESKMYAELTSSMLFDTILSDDALYQELQAGDKKAVEKLQPVMDKLAEIKEKGLVDAAVNETYPEDNYDQAILHFFEGDVPFWVCNTEKVSGMKKRETKSEAFQENPFEYTYIYAPMGEKGGYAFREPWFGFSVNKNSENYEYAVEFIRFLAQKDEINKMADVKGIPSVAVEKNVADIYQNILEAKDVQAECVNEGKITWAMVKDWYTCTGKFASGEFATGTEALEAFVEMCGK